MSDTIDSASTASAAETPPFRYSAQLAGQIEQDWQDLWESEGTFSAPNPAGPWADPEGVAAREKLFVLDMFPYPSGAGLHVGHPLGYIATDVYGRYQRMRGLNVLHALGYDAFGLPAEQYAVQTGQHPRKTTEENIVTMRRQLRRLGLAHDARRSVATTDPEFVRWTQWMFLRIWDSWYDTDADGRPRPGAPDRRAGARVRGRRPCRCRTAADWADLGAGERRDVVDGYRLAYVSEAPVNWCPGPGHGAVQRGGHQRGPQRARQLPRLQAQPAPVDDADQRLLRPADRRPGPAGLARAGQADAAQLDRSQPRCAGALPACPAARTSRCSPPGRTRCSARRSWCWRPSTRWSTRSCRPPGRTARRDAWTGGASDPARRGGGVPAPGVAEERPGAADRGPGEDRRVHRRASRPTR